MHNPQNTYRSSLTVRNEELLTVFDIIKMRSLAFGTHLVELLRTPLERDPLCGRTITQYAYVRFTNCHAVGGVWGRDHDVVGQLAVGIAAVAELVYGGVDVFAPGFLGAGEAVHVV